MTNLDQSLDDIIKKKTKSSSGPRAGRNPRSAAAGGKSTKDGKTRSTPYTVPTKAKAKEARDARAKDAAAATQGGAVVAGLFTKKFAKVTERITERLQERKELKQQGLTSGTARGRAINVTQTPQALVQTNNSTEILNRLGNHGNQNQPVVPTAPLQRPSTAAGVEDAPRSVRKVEGSFSVSLSNSGPISPTPNIFAKSIGAITTGTIIRGRGASGGMVSDREGRVVPIVIRPTLGGVADVDEDMDLDDMKPDVLSRVATLETSLGLNRAAVSQGVGSLRMDVADGSSASQQSTQQPVPRKAVVQQHTQSAPAATDVGTTVVISNLHPEATEDDIRATFGALGTVLSCSVSVDPNDKTQGRCEIKFKERPAADEAVSTYNNMIADGKSLIVEIKKEGLSLVGTARSRALQPDTSRPAAVPPSVPQMSYQPQSQRNHFPASNNRPFQLPRGAPASYRPIERRVIANTSPSYSSHGLYSDAKPSGRFYTK
ncbi:RNA-binding domain-containing protein [Gonapodya prolifera JEL478]|uniref:RNA-binding domain-containing protein n=1 Tax=Gonapodya prolifera (strain JEL478) TaxID=1344416 RepID=A0A139AM45_GONPJ|nr:RNA-binding domain-containing protein [Gonapodya prolifera JEL478]|eukprot:KXS17583.1 RNA-binding domain-containing protein [Gonapodya prolifera JEL478]